MISFGPEVCGDLLTAEKREWLVTNGIGGFASGTVAGDLTRRYHGLLFAALHPPDERTLLVSKFDETVTYLGHEYVLETNDWVGEGGETYGHRHVINFRLDGTTPVWRYALSDALLEKRIWMQPGANTTYVSIRLLRATAHVSLQAKALVNYRHFHGETTARDWKMDISPVPGGLKVVAYDGAIPFYLLSDRGDVEPRHDWYHRFHLMREANRGLGALDDNLFAGAFSVVLEPGDAYTFVASIDATPNLDGTEALRERRQHEAELLALSRVDDHPAVRQLVLAADQFIVKRPHAGNPHGRSIIAGYHWFQDWGRDTMIALPGLTLSTGRPELAAQILRTYALYENRGMLPNRIPAEGTVSAYNTVDAALWYVEALRAYHAATGDDTLIAQLFPVLMNIVAHYERGTRYGIQVDPDDGLLHAGEPGRQLTWMDAKIDDFVVTPRVGKPVEINALWYNALRIMVDFAPVGGVSAEKYEALASATAGSFHRFWNEDVGYLYDVIDSKDGPDATVRPNAIFAVSLPHTALTEAQQRAVLDVVAHELLTPYGLRTLAPNEEGYRGMYGGDPEQRDKAYHQGTVWAWLIGPFVNAHLRVFKDPKLARSFLQALLHQIHDHGLGTISEIFDAEPPFNPHGAIAQAWSVAAVLRGWEVTSSRQDRRGSDD